MKEYEVSADFTVTKTIGYFIAESEEEAIEQAKNMIRDIAADIGCGEADNVWAEVMEE